MRLECCIWLVGSEFDPRLPCHGLKLSSRGPLRPWKGCRIIQMLKWVRFGMIWIGQWACVQGCLVLLNPLKLHQPVPCSFVWLSGQLLLLQLGGNVPPESSWSGAMSPKRAQPASEAGFRAQNSWFLESRCCRIFFIFVNAILWMYLYVPCVRIHHIIYINIDTFGYIYIHIQYIYICTWLFIWVYSIYIHTWLFIWLYI
jgi:hypothetical protein